MFFFLSSLEAVNSRRNGKRKNDSFRVQAHSMVRVCSSAYSLVLGHHHRRVVVVVLEAAVCSTLQQQSHRVHLTSATGVVQRRVPAV